MANRAKIRMLSNVDADGYSFKSGRVYWLGPVLRDVVKSIDAGSYDAKPDVGRFEKVYEEDTAVVNLRRRVKPRSGHEKKLYARVELLESELKELKKEVETIKGKK